MGLTIGQTLQQRYQIQGILGQGGMGIVYQAYDPVLQRTVAIKVLPPQLTIDAELVSRFQREAIASANLRHPHIVTVHDVGQQEGEYFILMEYLEGNTLEQWLAQHGPMPGVQVGQVLGQIASALDHAHSRGIIHRDVKPSNIMLDSQDRAVLMDFGLVRAGEGLGPTRSTTVMGTPEYMAPEQVLGQAIDRRTDIYALGVVIYELLSGKTPFAHTTPLATAHAHAYEAPPPLRLVNKAISAPMEAVVMKALVKDPTARYQNAGDLAEDFDQALSGVMPIRLTEAPPTAGNRKKPSASPAGGVKTIAMRSPASGIAPAPARPRRTKAGALWAAGALAAVVLLLTAVLWPRGGASGGSSSPTMVPAIVVAATATASSTPFVVSVAPTDAAAPVAVVIETATPASALMDTAPTTLTPGAPPTRSSTATPIPTDTATATATATATIIPTPFVISQGANVRDCPSRNCQSSRQVAAGESLAVVCSIAETDGAWYKLDNDRGWVRSDVVTLNSQLMPCPAAAVTPTPRAAVVSSGAASGSSGGSCRTTKSLPVVTLIAPAIDKTCNGPVRFTWQVPYTLQSGEIFEVHIWADRSQNRGNIRRTIDTSAVIDIRKDVPWINWIDSNRAHFWEVVVVCKATGDWVSQEPRARLFYFETRLPVDENNPDSNCR